MVFRRQNTSQNIYSCTLQAKLSKLHTWHSNQSQVPDGYLKIHDRKITTRSPSSSLTYRYPFLPSQESNHFLPRCVYLSIIYLSCKEGKFSLDPLLVGFSSFPFVSAQLPPSLVSKGLLIQDPSPPCWGRGLPRNPTWFTFREEPEQLRERGNFGETSIPGSFQKN